MKNETILLPLDVERLPVTPLKAGGLTCVYEYGALRYIKHGGIEVVRMIYSAVRDAQWHTAPYTITDEKIEAADDRFVITCTAHYRLHDIEYKSQIEIKGAANRIAFRMQGEALSSFKSNRIGLCVLHPIESCAGEKARIEQPDGTTYDAYFPESISPRQPFLNIRNLHWKAGGLVNSSLFFEGDIFETEDQRNWTDNSYKTYSTPLSQPIPKAVNKGDTIDQKIILDVPEIKEASKKIPQNQHLSERHRFPKIGYAKGPGSEPLSDAAIQLLQQVPFDHYRVELYLSHQAWKATWTNALADAKRLGTTLEVVLFFNDAVQEELAAFKNTVQPNAQYISTLLPISATNRRTTEALLKQVYGDLKKLHVGISVGFGTDGFFADLNRNRPQTEMYDFLSFSLNPQVHLTDTRTVIENLEAQRHILKTIKTFSPDKAVYVSPVTFKIRFADQVDVKQKGGFDARQHTSFGAWWTLACIANLNQTNKITLFQVIGPCGILNDETATEQTPLFHTLKQIRQFNPIWIASNAADQSIILENETGDTLVYKLDAS